MNGRREAVLPPAFILSPLLRYRVTTIFLVSNTPGACSR